MIHLECISVLVDQGQNFFFSIQLAKAPFVEKTILSALSCSHIFIVTKKKVTICTDLFLGSLFCWSVCQSCVSPTVLITVALLLCLDIW